MSVWVVCPSKRSSEHVEQWAKAWRERGYSIALWRDFAPGGIIKGAECFTDPLGYPGYGLAVNRLVRHVMEIDSQAEWFIAAGDDIYPDPNKSADEIARECSQHFFKPFDEKNHLDGTFGVMQPTGDRWGENPNAQDPKMRSAYIDRVAGSAWIGREFARRMYQGNGPLWSGYTHQFVDEELQNVAIKYGVFWQRLDLTQLHQHWGRPKPGERMGHTANMPDFLKEANSPEHWDKFKKLFEQRKAAGFPGSEPQ